MPPPHPPAFVPPEHGFVAFAHDAERDAPKAAAKALAPLAPVSEDFPRLFAKTRGFKLGAPHDIRPTEDGKHVFFLRAKAEDARQSLYEVDLTRNQEVEVLSPETLLGDKAENLTKEERARRERMRITTSGLTSYEATKDGNDVVAVLSGRLFHWSRKTGTTTELETGDGAVDPHLSPDGKRVAYVRSQDLYAIGLDGGKEERITLGGTERKTHGLAEFIAQEELDRERGFWWSPDSKSILYEEADTSKVETYFISDPAHPERPPDANPYPRAGTTNATLRFGVVSSHGGATKWIAFDNAKYPYVAKVTWQKNAPPTFYALDRAERNGLLFTANPSTGKISTLLEEHDAAWLDVDTSCPQWLDDGSAFLWSSEKSGAWQLELHDKSGATKDVVVKAERGYRALLKADSKKHVAFVEASPVPAYQWVESASLDGSAPPRIDVEPTDWVSAGFGDSTDVYAAREATLAEMPRWYLRWVGSSQVREIHADVAAPPFFPKPQMITLGPDQPAVVMIRPLHVSAAAPHSLALIDAAYGGPGYTTVISDMTAYLRAQWIADETGAIVVSIDAKGTPYRGRNWERALQNKMGDVPLEGHIEAIRELEKRFPEIDPNRVGIYGWSYGGYLSAYAALKRPDIFKVAVAGAPPADWCDYDTAYTERYLGNPNDNGAAYDASSLLPLAEKPAGAASAAMLVIHGTADDNVYFLNSLKLVSALARGHRSYDFVPVPGVTHMLYAPDTSGPVWAQVATFLRDHLRAAP